MCNPQTKPGRHDDAQQQKRPAGQQQPEQARLPRGAQLLAHQPAAAKAPVVKRRPQSLVLQLRLRPAACKPQSCEFVGRSGSAVNRWPTTSASLRACRCPRWPAQCTTSARLRSDATSFGCGTADGLSRGWVGFRGSSGKFALGLSSFKDDISLLPAEFLPL